MRTSQSGRLPRGTAAIYGWQGRGSVRTRRTALSRSLRVLYLLIALASVHCQPEPRRIPYIPPQLHNWPQPYRGVPGLAAQVIVTGFVELPDALVYRGGSWTRMRQLPVPILVVQHPQKGVLVVDTGPRRETAPERLWPGTFVLPVEGFVRASVPEDLSELLQRAGIRPAAVRWVVQTNLRAVRSGNLRHFAKANVVVSAAERDYATRQTTGYDVDHWSTTAAWVLVDFATAMPLGTFSRAVDLLGDGSVFVIDGRGPTPGTLLVLARLPRRALLWSSDVVLTAAGLRTAAEPRGLWNAAEWWLRFWQVKRLRDLAPEVEIVPAFDTSGFDASAFPAKFHGLPTPMRSPTVRPTPNRWERIVPRPW